MRIFTVVSFVVLAFMMPVTALAWQADNGDGTYTNPPLYADYPDPDIIRIGEDFYFASTTFANSPGLVLLHSRDLVNWNTVGYAIDRLDGDPRYDMTNGTAYRNGVFAPSLRYHNQTFYIAVTPNGKHTRIYSSKDIHGPWKNNDIGDSAFDPGLFFDDDGTAYLFTSGGWDGHVSLKTLSPELDKVVATKQIFFVKGIEGSKALKINGWYYLFNALPSKLALMCSRSRSLTGSWETIKVLDDKTGGHQGAIVDLPTGDWYGFVMRDCGAIGRMTNICPITWKDNWPLWGEADHLGQVPLTAKKPIAGQPPISWPSSTNFDSPQLPLEFEWNHNPDNQFWSLTERPGYLRLRPGVASDFWTARNSLTHKGWGPTSCATATLDLTHVQPTDHVGLGMLGKSLATLAVQRASDGTVKLILNTGIEHGAQLAPVASADIGKVPEIQLALQMDFISKQGRCAYSSDGQTWTAIGDGFPLLFDWRTGTFQGEQYALFCFSNQPSSGFVDVKSVRFDRARIGK